MCKLTIIKPKWPLILMGSRVSISLEVVQRWSHWDHRLGLKWHWSGLVIGKMGSSKGWSQSDQLTPFDKSTAWLMSVDYIWLIATPEVNTNNCIPQVYRQQMIGSCIVYATKYAQGFVTLVIVSALSGFMWYIHPNSSGLHIWKIWIKWSSRSQN